jgi:hypothetical protein
LAGRAGSSLGAADRGVRAAAGDHPDLKRKSGKPAVTCANTREAREAAAAEATGESIALPRDLWAADTAAQVERLVEDPWQP